MKCRVMYLRIYLLLLLSYISLSIAAQDRDNDIQLLQGKWELEIESCEASLHSKDGIMALGIDNISAIELYQTIEIMQNLIILYAYDESHQEVSYRVEEDVLSIGLPSEDLVVDWEVREDKLYLKRSMLTPFNNTGKIDESGKTTVLFVYKKVVAL